MKNQAKNQATNQAEHLVLPDRPTTLGIPSSIFWPGLVVALLTMSVSIGAVTIYLATSDPSFAVEKDYYRKALAWDETAAARRASDALGWTAVVEVARDPLPSGERTIRVLLFDDQREPITDATVTVEAFAHARSRDRARPELTASPDGSYTGRFRPGLAGLWQFRVHASRGEDSFDSDLDQFVILDRS